MGQLTLHAHVPTLPYPTLHMYLPYPTLHMYLPYPTLPYLTRMIDELLYLEIRVHGGAGWRVSS
jgi:hypothetical protein